MSSTSDTPDIDEKKESTTTTSSTYNIGNFLKTIAITIIIILLNFTFAGITLYNCKLCQSNILPTDMDCSPYNINNKPDVQPILTNIFIQNTEPPQSEKLKIPYDKTNMKNVILDMICKAKNNPNVGWFTMFLLEQIQIFFHFNYSALNIFYNLLNQAPEICIVLFGPILTFIYIGLTPIFGFFVFAYHYFLNFKWFFKTNINKETTGQPNWSDVTILKPLDYGIGIFFSFIFIIVFFIFVMAVPVCQVFIMLYCLFSMLGYSGILNGKNTNVWGIVKELMKYYKVTMMIILSIIVIITTFTNLGTISGFFSILVVILIYFKIIDINLYDHILSNNLSELVSSEQAEKKCSKQFKHDRTWYDFFVGGNHVGGDFTKHLKKLNKKICEK